MIEIVNFIRGYYFFRFMPDSVILQFLNFCYIKKYAKGEVIYKENNNANMIYFIKSGDVQMA